MNNYGTFNSLAGDMLNVFLIFAGIFFIFYSSMAFIRIILYVIRSLSLYRLAENRKIINPWISWIPIINIFIIGKLADDINYRKHKKSSFSVFLLAGAIIIFILHAVIAIFAGLSNFEITNGYYFINSAVTFLPLLILLGIIKIACAVFMYMSLYIIYSHYRPKDSTLWIILSIIFSVTIPFFLLTIRNYPPDSEEHTQPNPNVYTTTQNSFYNQSDSSTNNNYYNPNPYSSSDFNNKEENIHNDKDDRN